VYFLLLRSNDSLRSSLELLDAASPALVTLSLCIYNLTTSPLEIMSLSLVA
jgi:hypothetical protein